MSNTSNLALPYLAVGQAQKHVTVNESLRRLDALPRAHRLRGLDAARAAALDRRVKLGEVALLDSGAMAWDVSLFQAIFDANDCHFGVSGGFSLVRRP